MSETKNEPPEVFRGSFEEEHLQEHLERVAEDLKISSPKFCIKLGTKTGDNYVGVIYRASIEGEKDGVPVKTETIFKVSPKDEVMRLTLQVTKFFNREHIFYTELAPILNDFLHSKNKSLENIPLCYFSSVIDYKEVICLEDLSSKGFVMRDRLKQMDHAHTTLALRALGRFHAISFALRDQRPEIFASKIAVLKEVLFSPEVIAHERFVTRFTKLGDLVKTALAEEDPKYTERLTAYLKVGLSHMGWSSEGSAAEPYAVLGHGDFWMNNLLFKYKEDSSEPLDIYFLDFQMLRYSSPVVDVAYILFCNCSQEFREKYFNEMLKAYHESLSDYLSELGSDPEKLFPFEALLAQLKKFSVNIAGMAVLVLAAFTSRGLDDKGFVSENADLPALEERIHRDEFWRNTARDTFKDLIDRNYI